jgi:hypothetical protein
LGKAFEDRNDNMKMGVLLPTAQFNGKREAVSRLEVEKALYLASDAVASAIINSLLPCDSNIGTLDLWELENRITQILAKTVDSISEVAPSMGEDLSFEIKRRRSMLVDDLINLFTECLKDAFGPSVKIEHSSARKVSVRLSSKIARKDFIQKDFRATIYDVLRYLLGNAVN